MGSGPGAHEDSSHEGQATPVVARRALFARLTAGGQAGVTLISAPPGSGKTVLLRSWIADAGLSDRVAWVTVERGEQDPQRFWVSVIAKLRAAAGNDAFIEKLTPSPGFDGVSAVDRLLSELGSLEEPVVLVIDDLHELRSREASSQLETFLARRPPRLRVILATRRDPQLGLHLLRLAGELHEIRDSDLRFTVSEARDLLGFAGIELSDAGAAQLHARTEGWVAGLRLAALSLAGHPDPDRFIASFSGSDRAVADYLLAEVLERQPDEVKTLLLRTSILDRMNGALADLLVGSSGSERILLMLEQQNAFVFALDTERSWFRCHQLFADLLRLELRRTDPGAIPTLHRAAAGWYADHGFIVDAVRHAQSAEDWQYATRLLADHGLSLALNGEDATVRGLLAGFPRGQAPEPELALFLAFGEMTGGSLDDAEAYVAVAQRGAPAVPDGRRLLFDVEVMIMRLALARLRGDFDSVVEQAESLQLILDSQAAGEVVLGNDARAMALLNLGVVELYSFRIEEAKRHLEQGLDLGRRTGRPYIEVACLSHLGAAAVLRSYDQARSLCSQAIAVADAQGWSTAPFVCVALATMGLADVSQGRFEDAQYWLERAGRAVRPNLEPAAALLVRHAEGVLHLASNRLKEALVAFSDVDRFQTMLVSRHLLTLQAKFFLVQTQLGLGDIAAARATLACLTEEERRSGEGQVATASLLLADGDPRAAADTVAPVLGGTTPGLGRFSMIHALLLHAIACDRLGEKHDVESDIEQALRLAEPDAIVFPFIIVPVRTLLERHPRHRTAHPDFLSEILDVLGGSSLPPRSRQPLEPREDLSDSELRILRFLPSNLSAPEIASELYLSTSTVKTHMRHIYAKFEVHTRTEAVECARRLGLLGPSSRVRR